jgi:hypothetical protein
MSARHSLERAGFWLIVGCLGVVQFNLLGAQVLFGLAAICWVIVLIRGGVRPPLPAFAWLLALYSLLTLVSAAFSVDPRESFIDSKQLVLFLIVPVVMTFARGSRATTVLDVILALGAAGAMVGIVEFALLGQNTANNRPMGMLSHYMTYSGACRKAGSNFLRLGTPRGFTSIAGYAGGGDVLITAYCIAHELVGREVAAGRRCGPSV